VPSRRARLIPAPGSCVRRLAVEFILDLLATGQSEAGIVANYPDLAHEDVLACLAYASHLAHEYKAYPLPV
jgi:uncharacterized protein (DUF433 family)